MMRNVSLFAGVLPVCLVFLLMFPRVVAAQTGSTAPVKVIVTDMKGKKRVGETILFVDTVAKKTFSGVTNARGEFKIQLPAGAVYQIRIKSIGEELKHTTLEIPKLNEGEYYESESVVTIQFEPGKVFQLNNVYFDTGKATLKPSSYAELNDLVEYLKMKPSVKIEVAGHTDDVGDDAANMKLSQDRAQAVKAYLLKKGIAADRIVAKGYGETRPVATNDTPEGRQKNRRTEVTILSE